MYSVVLALFTSFFIVACSAPVSSLKDEQNSTFHTKKMQSASLSTTHKNSKKTLVSKKETLPKYIRKTTQTHKEVPLKKNTPLLKQNKNSVYSGNSKTHILTPIPNIAPRSDNTLSTTKTKPSALVTSKKSSKKNYVPQEVAPLKNTVIVTTPSNPQEILIAPALDAYSISQEPLSHTVTSITTSNRVSHAENKELPSPKRVLFIFNKPNYPITQLQRLFDVTPNNTLYIRSSQALSYYDFQIEQTVFILCDQTLFETFEPSLTLLTHIPAKKVFVLIAYEDENFVEKMQKQHGNFLKTTLLLYKKDEMGFLDYMEEEVAFKQVLDDACPTQECSSTLLGNNYLLY